MTIDRQAPRENHGMETDVDGSRVKADLRLYQLVR